MKPSEPLRKMLSNHARTYTGAEFDIRFDAQPRISQDGECIRVWNAPGDVLGVDMSGANELRVIRDTLNHECAHYRYSELAGKAAFSARYPENEELAGTVLNILEDAYIDSRRLAERPGMRSAHAFFSRSQVADADVSEQPVANALVNSIHYYALAGFVPGIRNADDRVREFASFVVPHIDAARRHDDALEREAIAGRVTDALIRALPDEPDLDDLLDDLADEVSGDVAGEPQTRPPTVEPDDLDDVEAEVVEADALPDEPDKWADEDDEDEQGEDDADDAEQGDAAGDESADADEQGDGEDADGGDGSEPTDDETGEDDASDGSGDAETEDTNEDAEADTDAKGGENDDVLDELDDADERGENPEYHGLDDDAEYDEPDERDESRYENVENTIEQNETDMGRRKADRNVDAKHTDLHRNDATSDEVREVLRATGLAEDVRSAFEKFATMDAVERSESGDRLNVEAAIRHMSGNYAETDVFETTRTAATGGRCIGVALDLSSSMGSDNTGSETVNDVLDESGYDTYGAIVDAKVALGAIHLAAHELNDRFVASGFHSGSSTPLITGPGESFEWEHLDAVTPTGSTPTAHGVLDTLGLIRAQGGKDELMLVVTDGNPQRGHSRLDGGSSTGDASVAVRMAREQGVGVIGIAVGTSVKSRKMDRMFGDDAWVRAGAGELVDTLVSIYAEQLDYAVPAGY